MEEIKLTAVVLKSKKEILNTVAEAFLEDLDFKISLKVVEI